MSVDLLEGGATRGSEPRLSAFMRRSTRRWRPVALTREQALAAVVWLALALLLCLGGLRHEPWFDEAQAWLIATDSNPVEIVSRIVRYEGTPGLWHLLLWTLAKAGLPYGGLYLVSASFALAGAALVLFRSPFPLWMRVGVVFSYFFAYQYAVVARSYALDVALLPLLAMLFQRRAERPLAYGLLLGVIANVNAHSFVIAVPLGVDFALACLRRRAGWGSVAGVGLCAFLGLAAALQAMPPHDPNFQSAGGFDIYPSRALAIVVEGLIDRANPFAGGHGGVWGATLSSLVVSATAVLALRAGRGVLAAAMLLSLMVFFGVVGNNYWHSGIVFLVLVFLLWISWPAAPTFQGGERAFLFAVLALLFSYQGVYTAAAWARDLATPYSASREAAARLAEIEHALPGQRIAASGFKTLAVLPMLPGMRFANMGLHARRFYRWDRRLGPVMYPDPSDWSALTRSQTYDWLLLSPDSVRHTFPTGAYVAMAARNGFCLEQDFPGRMIWKTRTLEPDDLLLFRRCQGAA